MIVVDHDILPYVPETCWNSKHSEYLTFLSHLIISQESQERVGERKGDKIRKLKLHFNVDEGVKHI
jgi:hypothetical protein